MKLKAFSVFSIVVVTSIACGSRGSDRNESCQSTADCTGNLVCINGACGPVNLGITADPNQCVAVQCMTANDCCANPPCMNFACTAAGMCMATTTCMTDMDCFGQTPHCNNGTCVECVTSTDCGMNETCTNNTCSGTCAADNECPIFYGCQMGACAKVGCASDRECVLYDDSEFAFCDQTKMPPACSVKCDNDSECGKLELCVNSGCVPAGCTTDEECKAILGPLPPGEHAVCQPPM